MSHYFELYFTWLFVFWIIVYTCCSGGPAMRLVYAFKIGLGTKQPWMIPVLYLQSFTLEAGQINGLVEFHPEVNSVLEKHLALALDGKTNYEMGNEFWTSKPLIRVYYHRGFRPDSTNSDSIRFLYEKGQIGEERMMFSPSVYRLLKLLMHKEAIRKKERERAKKRNVLN
ncbi:hypothetical protein DQT32_04080 [Salmonella enterica subsp. enterica serovar Braenderup]|nr:hypothetical protein [Salmonella enterica subsp. enterica serovar Braenderup]